ncbi:methyl-accepting chemotaxis protein [Cohnella zeiphila]|uniref:Methyl-accepting chemotaxis protein n=1 Tax=Cohnella zeiphila TaxID=2761120 RepID=A0A7X0SUZ7_9BACL|nr:methyl-accepting chemotaxis protein [Cohnella zeiphila]MBB6735405.1 methyl-accepting chemotaxis protein [Cohnella zeiphila]
MSRFARIAHSPLRSVGSKLFLVVTGGILACVVTLGWFSYDTSRSVIERKVTDSSLATTTQTAARLDLILAGYERRTTELLNDSRFQDLLSRANDAVAPEARSAARQLSSLLSSELQYDNLLSGIYLIPADEKRETIGTVAGSAAQRLRSVSLPLLEARQGDPIWLPTLSKGLSGIENRPTIVVARPLSNMSSSKPYMWLTFEIDVLALEQALGTIDLGEGSAAYIVADDGRIVYSPVAGELASPYPFDRPPSGGYATGDQNGRATLTVGAGLAEPGWQLIGNIPVSVLHGASERIRNLTVLLSLVSVAVAAGIGFYIFASVSRPLQRLRLLMNDGEKGRLNVRSALRRKDEIGEVAGSFDRMMEQMAELVRQTNGSADEVLQTASSLADASRRTAQAAREIAAATQEIASGAVHLAAESERGSEMTENIGARVRSVVGDNEAMGLAVSEVEAAGEQGSASMTGLIGTTERTEESIRQLVSKIDALQESAAAIRRILDLLGDVAAKTNILSLNAAIEAARAGAGGKGFMVVADEIRSLADKSKLAIADVRTITDSIRREIGETVSALREVNPLFREQTAAVRDADRMFRDVRERMSGFVIRIGSASDSVDRLGEAQFALASAMDTVSSVAQQASATSEQVASLSNEQLSVSDNLVRLADRLESVSGELRTSLSRFVV